MKIAMTGASGFIGQRVVKALLDMDHQVIAILHHHPLDIGHANLKTIKISLDELARSKLAFHRLHQPEVLLDLGWQHLADYDNSSHLSEQVTSHFNLIENLTSQGLKRVVGVGTCFEYGAVSGEITEEHSCLPELNYPKGKLALLHRLQALQQQVPFELVWLRPFYVYGLNQARPTLFSAIQSAIDVGNESFELKTPYDKHDFLSVDELGELIAKLVGAENANGVINCCSGQVVSVHEVAKAYLDEQGSKMKLTAAVHAREPADALFYGSTQKLNQVLAADL